MFNAACQHNHPNKQLYLKQYIASQKQVNNRIEEAHKANTSKIVNQITKEGGAKSNMFWRTRSQILKHNKRDETETKDEKGTPITDPIQAKEHIANYYEELYQAREGEDSHKEWTNHINRKIQQIESTPEHTNASPPPPFTLEELNQSIKIFKRNKNTGPDRIPNEIYIEANEITKQIFLHTMNEVYTRETIPAQWQQGNKIRIYKGKGNKGKCSSERGITLASNSGKLFERLVNNRIKHEINTSEAQAGGQAGKSTADHITILNSIINHKKKNKVKNLYIAFLDVTKAYDKAWLNAILYVTHKNGLNGKNWRIVKELNSNLTAKIHTHHGDTREIAIRDSIRQGGVLSMVEYANLMDEIAKELNLRQVGNQQIWSNEVNGCLLWMDDVALIHHDKDELQRMLNITDDTAKKYHIQFGREKSQVITVGKTKDQAQFKLGKNTLDNTETYKYLGMTINSKGNLDDHIRKTKGKIEAALQTIFCLAGNDKFNRIEMSAIWQLVHTCILPTLLYGAETWTPTKTEIKEVQRILNNTLKRIIRAPITTPAEIVIAETGIWDAETQIARKQIMYYYKVKTQEKENSTTRKTATDPLNPWLKQVETTLTTTGIDLDEILPKNPKQAKRYINTKLKEHQIKKIYLAAEEKSKVRDYICNKKRFTVLTKPHYMENYNRTDCNNIFTTRARMLEVKGNYKGKHTDLICRWCKNATETQQHNTEKNAQCSRT